MEHLLNKYGVNQLGYYVKDAEEAAALHSKMFGSGPFTVSPVGGMKVYSRGVEVDLQLKVAYGQHKDLQIELIEVLSDEPNPYFELGRYGFHHVSIWSDDVDQVIADFEELGFKPAMMMYSGEMKIAYFDCRDPWGYYVEVHCPIQEIWDGFANQAKDWDGSNPVTVYGFDE